MVGADGRLHGRLRGGQALGFANPGCRAGSRPRPIGRIDPKYLPRRSQCAAEANTPGHGYARRESPRCAV